MKPVKEQLNVNVDLTQTTSLNTPDGTPIVFAQGTVLRKVSKFLTGAPQDQVMPIPVLYDVKTGKILGDMLPNEIKDEYKDIIL